MQWLQHLRNWTGQTKISDLANDIASRSYEAVWQRVYPSVVGMSPAEARGYARARAAVVVRDKIELTLTRLGDRRIDQQRVYSLAMETVVCRTVTQAMAQRARPLTIRRAA